MWPLMGRRDEASDYSKALASWQIERDLDHRDLTTPQGARMLELAVAVSAGLDPVRIRYAAHLVKTGRIEP